MPKATPATMATRITAPTTAITMPMMQAVLQPPVLASADFFSTPTETRPHLATCPGFTRVPNCQTLDNSPQDKSL